MIKNLLKSQVQIGERKLKNYESPTIRVIRKFEIYTHNR